MRAPFRRKNLSPRLLPHYALAAAVFWLAQPTAATLALGGVLAAAGTALRAWAAGHLLKTEALVVTGPYRHLRHPLYAGTLLIALGFGVAAGPTALVLVAALFLPLFFLYYLPYKERRESERLARHYGDDYAAYRAGVPALVPSRTAWTPPPGFAAPATARWSAERFRANDEPGVVLGVVLAFVLLALRPLL